MVKYIIIILITIIIQKYDELQVNTKFTYRTSDKRFEVRGEGEGMGDTVNVN